MGLRRSSSTQSHVLSSSNSTWYSIRPSLLLRFITFAFHHSFPGLELVTHWTSTRSSFENHLLTDGISDFLSSSSASELSSSSASELNKSITTFCSTFAPCFESLSFSSSSSRSTASSSSSSVPMSSISSISSISSMSSMSSMSSSSSSSSLLCCIFLRFERLLGNMSRYSLFFIFLISTSFSF